MKASQKSPIRCAVYTRKSVDEGLDQEINSLTVQREAAEAYIASQKSEGWVCLPTAYDDGGFTGANMKRPALQQLLQDIAAGLVDCVVVYKVDRLSRSLLDFAKLSDTFSQHDVAFVSVTQQINTGTSMGKLMLGILISFAQFERETIAERTRDRMASARRKGRWIGGRPPLGYDINREASTLEINETEAEQVREIFALYLRERSLSRTVACLDQRGITLKTWITRHGQRAGGGRVTKSSLHGMLKNRTYLGEVVYKGDVFPGLHPPIIDPDLFTQVQETLAAQDLSGGERKRNKHNALLRGLLVCHHCNKAMSHTFSRKKSGKVYRYYVCQTAMKESWAACPTKSVSAGEIEAFIIEQLRTMGHNPTLQKQVTQNLLQRQAKEIQTAKNAVDRLQREARRLARQIHTAVVEQADSTLLVHLNEQVAANTLALQAAQAKRKAAESQTLSEREVAVALSRFDPAWQSLQTHERCALIRSLIERVTYNGETGDLDIEWKEAGIYALNVAA